MKKLLVLATLIGSMLVAVGCGKSDQYDNQAPPPATDPNAPVGNENPGGATPQTPQ
jgi:hypothetical protein